MARPPARRHPDGIRRSQWRRTPLNVRTIQNMQARGFRVSGISPRTGAESYVYDSSSHPYQWLLPGWLVEERVTPFGRVYKYYYDPAGRQYKTKYEVLDQWDRLGMVVLDP